MFTAQHLYDRREQYGEIDGNDLHAIFATVCDDPSPTGRTSISTAALAAYAADMRAAYAAHQASGTRGTAYLLDIAAFCEAFVAG